MIGLACCLLLVPLPQTAASEVADDGMTIVVQGVAVFDGDIARARQLAVRDALRQGIEQTVGAVVQAWTHVSNFDLVRDAIVSKSQGYVSAYTIQTQQIRDGHLHLSVEMTIREKIVEDDLQALEVALRAAGDPTLAVVVSDEARLLRDADITRNRLAHNLLEYGVFLRETSTGGASLIVEGKNRVSQIGIFSGLISYRSDLSITMRVADTRELIFSESFSATGVHNTDYSAAVKASEAAADKATASIRGRLFEWLIGSGVTLELRLLGVDLAAVQEFSHLMSRMPFVDKVLLRHYADGIGTLDVSTELTSAQLAHQLAAAFFDYTVDELSWGRIVVKRERTPSLLRWEMNWGKPSHGAM